MALTWSGSLENNWRDEEEEESMATVRAPLQSEITEAQAKSDAAFEDLQRRLNAAIMEVEQGRAREAALLRRALKSEEAEEALASQMADLEAEAFASITQANKLLPPAPAPDMEPGRTGQISMHVTELTARLQAALEDAAAWAGRCQDLEKEAEASRVREAALQRRAEMAEEGEEALASQIAELEAEAFTHLTKNPPLVEPCINGTEPISREELERRLAAAGQELEAVRTKLHQAEEKSRWLEMRVVAQLALEEEKGVTLKRGDDTLLSLSLEDLAGVKLKLWNPSSLALTSY